MTVVESNGHGQVDKAELPFPAMELGEVGLKEQRGIVQEEWLRVLQGEKGRKVLQQMSDNDSVLGAAMHAIVQLCRRVEWTTRPPDEDPVEEDTEFAESCRLDMSHSWEALIGEVMYGMPVYGWEAHEIVYKRCEGFKPGNPGESSRHSDGKIRWRKLPVRSQHTLCRWVFDQQGGVEAMIQRKSDGTEVLLPIEKLLLFRTTTARGNPEGRTALRNAYRPWWLKTRIEDQEAIGIERDLTGIPWFELPEEILDPAAPAEMRSIRESYERIGKNLRRDEQATLMTPLSYDENGNERFRFSLVGSPGSHMIDTAPVITRHNQTMAMSLLADVILLGHEKIGTQALSVSKVDLLAASLDTLLQGVAEVFNRHGLPRLFALNGNTTGNLPTYEPGSVKPDDVAQMITQIAQLAQAGAPLFPDEGLEDWLAEQVGYPTPERNPIGDLMAVPQARPVPRPPAPPPGTPGAAPMPMPMPGQPVQVQTGVVRPPWAPGGPGGA